MIKKYILLFIIGMPSYFLFGMDPDHLIFKRISTNPDNSEAVFIYNPTNQIINLNGPDGSYFLTDGYAGDDSNQHYTNIPFINDGYTISHIDDDIYNAGCNSYGNFIFSNNPDGLYDIFITDINNDQVDISYLNSINQLQCDGDVDECGLCNGPGIPDGKCDCFGNEFDCLGVCGGDSEDGDSDGICNELDDCIGQIDVCGVCDGDGSSCIDCNGDMSGYAYIDECGFCVGGLTGEFPCTIDCNVVINGSAFYDHCGDCVLGDTGNEPCQQDCFGLWGGSAAIDECGVCGGNGPSENYDCNNNCITNIDVCGVCSGDITDSYICDYGMLLDELATDDFCGLINDNLMYLSYDNKLWLSSDISFKDINFKVSGAIVLNTQFSNNNTDFNEQFWSQNYNDFFIQFPENASINPNETQIISMHNDSVFYSYYYYYPDYNIHELTTKGTETFNGSGQVFDYLENSGNNGESLILFYYDGISNRIKDVDYFLWGSRTFAIDKTNINNYWPDQASEFQSFLENTINHYSYNRLDSNQDCCLEYGETNIGGNGIYGHDETSENFDQSWSLEFNPEKTLGCMDDMLCAGINDYCALNYNDNSDVDYSELYDIVFTNNDRCIYNYGCMDVTKFNYDVEATKDYFSCVDESVYPLTNIEDILNWNSVSIDDEVLVSGKLVGFRLIEDDFWILNLRDENNFQIDITGSGWNIETSKLNYLVNPHNYTEHIVSVLGIVDEYNGGAQIAVDSERRIDDYLRYHRDGEFFEDYNNEINSAEIVAAPYVIIPSQGERLDFKYSFPSNSRVIIRVLSLDGRVITTLIDRFYDSSGTVMRIDELSDWDGRNHLGQIVSPGTYLFHIEASNFNTGSTSVDICPVVVGVNH